MKRKRAAGKWVEVKQRRKVRGVWRVGLREHPGNEALHTIKSHDLVAEGESWP